MSLSISLCLTISPFQHISGSVTSTQLRIWDQILFPSCQKLALPVLGLSCISTKMVFRNLVKSLHWVHKNGSPGKVCEAPTVTFWVPNRIRSSMLHGLRVLPKLNIEESQVISLSWPVLGEDYPRKAEAQPTGIRLTKVIPDYQQTKTGQETTWLPWLWKWPLRLPSRRDLLWRVLSGQPPVPAPSGLASVAQSVWGHLHLMTESGHQGERTCHFCPMQELPEPLLGCTALHFLCPFHPSFPSADPNKHFAPQTRS